MLGQFRRRWTNIKSTLSQRLVFAGINLYPADKRRQINGSLLLGGCCKRGPTLNQDWINLSCLLAVVFLLLIDKGN